jgi:catechol 2,3-dioxygenase-like lactoylglutathione lyase family enzyme
MKRFHVHVGVQDLERSIRFYSTLFAAPPFVRKPDYAKWMLEDPRVNFAISSGHGTAGLQHLGIQVEERAELTDVHERLSQAEGPVLDEGETTCCYARSEKSWIADPSGISWETFLTTGEHTTYGNESRFDAVQGDAACAASPCCEPSQPLVKLGAREPAPDRRG